MSKDDLLYKISEDIGGIKSSIKNIEKTQEDHTANFIDLVSWKNGIITMVTNEGERRYQQVKSEAKNELEVALKPYKDDLDKRRTFTSDVKKKGWDIAWDWGKMVILFGAGYLLTLIKNFR